MRTRASSGLALMAIAAVTAACGSEPEPPPTDAATLFWIGSDADALVKCSVAAQCGDQATNFGALGSLTVGGGALEHSRSYVKFLMPTFPPGTTVIQAQLELFHEGTREDGTTDEICLDVARASAAWQPLEVTWENQPLTSSTGSEAPLTLVSDGWSAADVTGAVAEHVASPDANHGFVVFADASMEIDKGFASNAHTSRTETELGRSPRLLLHIARPATGDIAWPASFDESTDLPFAEESIEIAESALGDVWPEEWQAASTSRCGP